MYFFTVHLRDRKSDMLDYIHFDPVKHGYVARPAGWAFSSFHRAVADGDVGDWGERIDAM